MDGGCCSVGSGKWFVVAVVVLVDVGCCNVGSGR